MTRTNSTVPYIRLVYIKVQHHLTHTLYFPLHTFCRKMNLVSFHITYVHDFHTDGNTRNYNLRFGLALLKQAAPQSLKCNWDELVVFPSLQAACNPSEEGIRLMDIVDMIGSDDIENNLKVSDFHIDDKGMVYMWVQKTRIPQLITTTSGSICNAISHPAFNHSFEHYFYG